MSSALPTISVQKEFESDRDSLLDMCSKSVVPMIEQPVADRTKRSNSIMEAFIDAPTINGGDAAKIRPASAFLPHNSLPRRLQERLAGILEEGLSGGPPASQAGLDAQTGSYAGSVRFRHRRGEAMLREDPDVTPNSKERLMGLWKDMDKCRYLRVLDEKIKLVWG
ncbi:hypothetical protein ElyMa_006616200 [Elysia marginata]|uniref:Uncharacterized protein n=1 Tax=Elysia marginata TaxID=1093978 RepID=A0AAV4IE55_9GAST|nr:hypothetical protein ElyMa_006616200 [Elysia marginata]